MNGMVATSQPLASAAALRVLQEGGNAVDAAICAAAVLNVVEPMMTGIGGDMFAIVFMQHENKPVGLNAGGWSGSKATPEFFKSRNLDAVPPAGIHSVSVPGAVAGWYKLHAKYGKTPIERLLQPAIEYAEKGFPVSEIIAGQWQAQEDRLRETPEARSALLLDGRAPRHGDVFKMPALARSLKILANGGRDAFYRGELAKKIVAFSEQNDGLLTLADFSEYDAQWVEPVSTNYRGYDVYELGPQTQGIVVLQMLNVLEAYDLKSLGHNSSEYLHLLIEAKKLAFADRDAYIADPDRSDVPVGRLLSKEYAAGRRRLIDPSRAMAATQPGMSGANASPTGRSHQGMSGANASPTGRSHQELMEHGETVYLTVVDRDRNAVSFINSIFAQFGSGLVAGDTGIVLQNRGSLFELNVRHPNVVAPRKRPFHTLIPGMLVKDAKPYYSFGVMGGDMQPQGHVQVILNHVDFGMDAQQAGEAPRFRHWAQGVALESAFDGSVRYALMKKGHTVIAGVDSFGGYQGILIDPKSGVLMGGSDPRKDGLAIGW